LIRRISHREAAGNNTGASASKAAHIQQRASLENR
jgi:hypothetical protein